MVEINVNGFGETGPCDAAHIIDDKGWIIGVVKEPKSRGSVGFPEEEFLARAFEEIRKVFTPPFWIEWDPDRDTAHEVYVIG